MYKWLAYVYLALAFLLVGRIFNQQKVIVSWLVTKFLNRHYNTNKFFKKHTNRIENLQKTGDLLWRNRRGKLKYSILRMKNAKRKLLLISMVFPAPQFEWTILRIDGLTAGSDNTILLVLNNFECRSLDNNLMLWSMVAEMLRTPKDI